METKTFVINIDEIREIYNKYCIKDTDSLSSDEFEEFLRFLEIDFFDWVRGNLKQFVINKN